MTSEAPMSDAQRIAALTEQIANLQFALLTARRIGMALGIVMATDGVAEEEAFDLMVRLSQRSAWKLRDLAELVITTGELSVARQPNESEIKDEHCMG